MLQHFVWLVLPNGPSVIATSNCFDEVPEPAQKHLYEQL